MRDFISINKIYRFDEKKNYEIKQSIKMQENNSKMFKD